ncbi:Ultraviolet N-glycosylase/AP lyase [Nocardia cerradoensis]|uniref:Ultraviolet N-glycosylase/AP lyase n=2 Tax=Nocardia cerradoensis TaxID=85688 RepID=A0A231GTA2_9NOCA|nr:hypothetical protein [Nocardia cerradoensis]OXR39854.1 Ultraviolet N-glycosylase/AP lyase [Nocardia cerradoensis]
METPVGDVIDVIRPAGFGKQRAAQLQGLLQRVAADCKERGIRRITLDWLRHLPDDDVESYLTSLPGISEKSARCVVYYSLDRQTLAVDTHVRRILDRLGVVADRKGKVRYADYEAVVPERLRQRLHVNLIHHGRAFCRSQLPKCGGCPLISFCPSGHSAGSRPVVRKPGANLGPHVVSSPARAALSSRHPRRGFTLDVRKRLPQGAGGQVVAGSNPVSPTEKIPSDQRQRGLFVPAASH